MQQRQYARQDRYIDAYDGSMTPNEILAARERGRQVAAQAILTNPESRKRVESKYGLKFCRKRYPEAYK